MGDEPGYGSSLSKGGNDAGGIFHGGGGSSGGRRGGWRRAKGAGAGGIEAEEAVAVPPLKYSLPIERQMATKVWAESVVQSRFVLHLCDCHFLTAGYSMCILSVAPAVVPHRFDAIGSEQRSGTRRPNPS